MSPKLSICLRSTKKANDRTLSTAIWAILKANRRFWNTTRDPEISIKLPQSVLEKEIPIPQLPMEVKQIIHVPLVPAIFLFFP